MTVPICMPAILDIAVYRFVNALTTVSAVVFLYGAQSKLAAISIVHMDEAGATASTDRPTGRDAGRFAGARGGARHAVESAARVPSGAGPSDA